MGGQWEIGREGRAWKGKKGARLEDRGVRVGWDDRGEAYSFTSETRFGRTWIELALARGCVCVCACRLSQRVKKRDVPLR